MQPCCFPGTYFILKHLETYEKYALFSVIVTKRCVGKESKKGENDHLQSVLAEKITR